MKQKIHKASSSYSPTQTNQSQFAPRPFKLPTKQDTHSPVNQEKSSSRPDLPNARITRSYPVSPIQAKLTIGQPGDKYEQEADRVASQVVQQINTLSSAPLTQEQSIQRHEETDEEIQAKREITSLQRQEASLDLTSAINSARSGGQPLDAGLQSSMGQVMGANFSQVKIHIDSTADQLNRSIQAKAFTTGNDIFFKRGEYNPSSRKGKELVAHELTHVVQQNGGTVQRHQDEDEVQMKPDLQLKQESNSGCECPSCNSTNANLNIQRKQSQSRGVQNFCNQKLVDSVKIQRQVDSGGHCSGCSCSKCSSVTGHIQMKSIGNQVVSISSDLNNSSSSVIQRHTAYEHYILGKMEPSEIAGIPMVREIPQLEQQLATLQQQRQQANSQQMQPEAIAIQTKINQAEQKKADVRHTLEQEMARLWEFKNKPEATPNEDQGKEIGKVEQDEDGKWQIPIVKLPVKGDGNNSVAGDTTIIVSYSEINTFPDFFGNPETIANTPKSAVLNLLQGVRQQAYIELSNLYKEIFGEDKNKLADWSNRENLGITQGDFKGAIGPRGQAVNDFAYETRTEMQVQGATERSKKEEKSQEYFAALERNACHFAPYSWDQWQGYHDKARELAKLSYRNQEIAEDFKDKGWDDKAPILEQKSAELGNQAMLQNAFGEHYLQDSFAAGHLIDKTGVMQAFTKWINANGKQLGSWKESKEQWAMASMIANKQGTNNDLKSNPQALDDSMMRGQLESVGQATNQVGLAATEDIKFMMWWRNAANANKGNKHLTPETAAQKCSIPTVKNNQAKGQELMEKLVAQNFAKKKTSGIFKKTEFYSLNQAQVDVLKGKGAYNAALGMKLNEDGQHDFTKEAEEFNLAAYNSFMSNAYIQGATKYFHDKYCREGLEVITGTGEAIGRIYGDAKMVSAGGQKGVEYSAKTSQMSREAIFNIVNGTPEQAESTLNIRRRFPTQVVVPGGVGPRNLANWNYQFLYTDAAFTEAASTGAKAAYKYKSGGGISGGNAINVEGIVKHDGDVF